MRSHDRHHAAWTAGTGPPSPMNCGVMRAAGTAAELAGARAGERRASHGAPHAPGRGQWRAVHAPRRQRPGCHGARRSIAIWRRLPIAGSRSWTTRCAIRPNCRNSRRNRAAGQTRPLSRRNGCARETRWACISIVDGDRVFSAAGRGLAVRARRDFTGGEFCHDRAASAHAISFPSCCRWASATPPSSARGSDRSGQRRLLPRQSQARHQPRARRRARRPGPRCCTTRPERRSGGGPAPSLAS